MNCGGSLRTTPSRLLMRRGLNFFNYSFFYCANFTFLISYFSDKLNHISAEVENSLPESSAISSVIACFLFKIRFTIPNERPKFLAKSSFCQPSHSLHL